MIRSLSVALLALVSTALACKVPVFRYALERWESDNYRAVILYRGETQKSATEALAAPLRETSIANLEVEMLDVSALTEEQQWQYDGLEDIGAQPVMRLYYPHQAKIEEPFWEGELSAETVSQTLDSPLRQKIVQAILEGGSTTWVLIESGDAEEDQTAETRLQRLLDDSASTLTIPEGVVRAEEVTAEGTTADGLPLEMDDVLRTGIPLKIEFPVIRVSPETVEETIFLRMLTGISPRLRTIVPHQPVAFPIFGRGRALEGIPGSALNESSIGSACQYLCGECSCQVKDQNPGIDLLLAVDWSEKLEGSLFMVERKLPALSGLGIETTVTAETPAPVLTAGNSRMVPRALALTLGGLLIVIVFGTYLMNRRQSG
ncbi:MAG: hypothetical protein ACI8T1_001587 [Verrucomicrobiales bacterium]|jgi:hypothetical protein